MVRPLRTLVIGDDLDVVALVLRSLSGRAGWAQPSHAVDGRTASGFLHRDAAPDLVILDFESPGLHGLELLCQVRDDSRFRRTALVVTGARGAPGERRSFLPGEVWITKPFDTDDLLTAVKLAQAAIAEDRTVSESS